MKILDKTRRQILEDIRVLRTQNFNMEHNSDKMSSSGYVPTTHVGWRLTNRFIFIGVGFAVLFWILESAIHTFIFHDRNLVEQLLRPNANELWMRVVVCFILISLSILTQIIFKQLKQAKEMLQQSHDKLEFRVRKRTAELAETNKRLQAENIDRKKAEEAIHEKEKQLENLLSNVDAIILEGDPFNIYYVGGQVEKILGYPKKLWFAEPGGPVAFWSKHLHPEDKDKIEICRQAIANGENHSFEYRLISSDGSEVWFYDTVTVECQNDKPVKARSIMIDITERRKWEEALRENACLNQTLLDSMPCVALLLRPHTREIVASNKAAVKVGAVPGKTCYQTWSQSETPCPWCLAPEVWATSEAQHLQPEEHGCVWDAHWLPVSDDLYMHYAFDITERKKTEQQIEDLARFPSENPNPVLRITQDGKVLYVNSAGQSLLNEWGCEINQCVPDYWRQVVSDVLGSNSKKNVEYKHEGRIISFEVTPIVESGYANLYGRDITERKKVEEYFYEYQQQLRSLASELSKAEEETRRRIAVELHDNIGHDLAITKMKAETLHEGLSGSEYSDGINEIVNSLIKSIKHVSSFTFELSPSILYELGLESALEWLAHKFQEQAGIICRFDGSGQDKDLSSDLQVLLFRCVRELLANIRKHAQAQTVSITAGTDSTRSRYRVIVEDNGIGFDSSSVALRQQYKFSGGGFGLFSITERLNYQGGSIKIDSESQRGSRIIIAVPLVVEVCK